VTAMSAPPTPDARAGSTATAASGPIGIIGVGLVGLALAERFRAAGHDVTGYDVDPARHGLLEAVGGTAAVSANDVADRCARVFIALASPAATQDVIETIATHLKSGAAIIDVGTGDPGRTEMLARRLLARGMELLDAPLSGSGEQIRNGTAVAMIGGSERGFAACAALWPVVAANVAHLGPPGAGQRAKLAANLLLGLHRAALAEGIAFAEALGLDPVRFVELLRITPASSGAVEAKAARMLERRYDPESRIAQHRRDVDLILEAASAARLPLPLSTAHAAQLDAAIAAGDGDLDDAAIVEVWRRARDAATRT